jgi:hypothetical protein
MRHLVPALALLLAACGGGEMSVRAVYGAWRLDRVAGPGAPGDNVPRFLQFTPGGEALLSRDGQTIERRRFSFRRAVPVGMTDERFMLVIEGEPDHWIAEAPDRRTLIITPNNFEDPPRTYLRER